MAYDTRFANSSGYFKDPVSGNDLSPDTPRVIPCEFKDGKFVWPQVPISDGSGLIKIVYKYFTPEEKELYKQYRGRDNSGSESKPKEQKEVRSPSARPVKIIEKEPEKDTVVTYNKETAVSKKTQDIIDSCDQYLGVYSFDGLKYALISKKDSNVVYHIPLECITEDQMQRLCNE